MVLYCTYVPTVPIMHAWAATKRWVVMSDSPEHADCMHVKLSCATQQNYEPCIHGKSVGVPAQAL